MRASSLAVLALALPLSTGCIAIDKSFTTRAVPQRPTFANNAYTTAPGTLEVESGVQWIPDESVDVPVVFKHGIDERSEVLVGVDPYRSVDVPGGDDATGFGDMFVGYKRRVLDQDDRHPAAAWEVSAKLPTASDDRGLGTGDIDLFTGGAATWDFDEWAANGYYRLGLVGAQNREGIDVQHLFSASGSRPLAERIDGFSELALLWTPAIGEEQLVADVGLQVLAAPGLVVDGAFYLGLSEDAPDVAFAIGLTSNFGRQSWKLPQ